MTSVDEIRNWYNRGVSEGSKRMIVWCDTFDYGDYPEFTDLTGNDLREYTTKEDGKNMKRLMEVYDLEALPEPQLRGGTRVFNY